MFAQASASLRVGDRHLCDPALVGYVGSSVGVGVDEGVGVGVLVVHIHSHCREDFAFLPPKRGRCGLARLHLPGLALAATVVEAVAALGMSRGRAGRCAVSCVVNFGHQDHGWVAQNDRAVHDRTPQAHLSFQWRTKTTPFPS
jgi:hypothetical protein